jgi:hypothetical protein
MLNGNSTLNASIHPTLQIAMSHALVWSEQNRTSLGAFAASQLMRRYIDPTYISLEQPPAGDQVLTGFQERARAKNLSSQHNLNVQWQALPNVPVSVRVGLNPVNSSGTTYVPAGLSAALSGVDAPNGAYSQVRSSALVGTFGGSLTAPVHFLDRTGVDLSIGGELVHQQQLSNKVSTTFLPVGVTDPTTFDPKFTTTDQYRSATSTYGMFLEPRLSIASRVFVQTGMRLDGGTASGDRAGLTRYPKLSVSWLAIDRGTGEDRNSKWPRMISRLRLRTALGQAGIQPNPIQHLRLLVPGMISTDGGATFQQGFNYGSVGNTVLRPERATEIEGGAEIDLLQDRASFSMTFYRKKQNDAIMPLTIARSVGVSGPPQRSENIGDILNTGHELQLNARLLESQPIRWTTSMSLSHRKNRLTKKAAGLQDASPKISSAPRLVVGYPVFGFWAAPIVGSVDDNKDGIIQRSEVVVADSATYLGTSDPKYDATFNTDLSLFGGRFTVSASVNYQHAFTQNNSNVLGALLASANAPNATLIDQAVATVSRFGDTKYYFVQTINALRFQSLSFGYTIPTHMTRLFRMQYGTVTLQGSNLGLRTGYRGMDPNVNAYARGNMTADFGQLPVPREWMLRFNFSR